MSWAGLRGAVPIVLATIPVQPGVGGTDGIFNIVFVLVVVYTLVQGPTLPWVARRLRLAADAPRTWTSRARRSGRSRRRAHVGVGPGLAAARRGGLRAAAAAGCRRHPGRPRRDIVRPAARTLLRRGDELMVICPGPVRTAAEQRLHAMSREGRLARWRGGGADSRADRPSPPARCPAPASRDAGTATAPHALALALTPPSARPVGSGHRGERTRATTEGATVPTYAYACTACDNRFEVRQSFSDDALTECPECAGSCASCSTRSASCSRAPGFYRNDSRAGPRRPRRRPRAPRGRAPRRTRARRARTRARRARRRTRAPRARPAPRTGPAGSSGPRRPGRPAHVRQLVRRLAADADRPSTGAAPSTPRRVGATDRRRTDSVPVMSSTAPGRGRGAARERSGRDRRHRRLGLLRLPRRCPRGAGRDPVRRVERPARGRLGRRPPGGVPPPPRARPPVAAAPGELPGQPLGAAAPRGAAGARAVRGRLAAPELGPGTFVVPDQLVDRTWGRDNTV